MATRVWQSTDGNWNNTASWLGATVPVTGDVVIFPAVNSQAVTSGLDQSSIILGTLRTEEGFTPDIGLSGTHLHIDCDVVIHRGSGTLFYSTGNNATALFVVDSPNWEDAAVIASDPGDLQTITVLRGKLAPDAGVAGVIRLEVGFRTVPLGDAIVDWTGAPSVPALTTMNAGFVTFADMTSSTIIVEGGRLLVNENANSKVNKLIIGGGVVDLRGNGFASDIIAQEIIVMGGVLTMNNDLRPKTITKLIVLPGGIALLPDTVTVTNLWPTSGSRVSA